MATGSDMESDAKPYILIVDDLDYNVYFIERIIEPFYPHILKAFSGKEALEKMRDVELALALIDVQMPEMDGLELAARIQGDPARGIVPIIFITAHAYDEPHLETFYQSGIIDFITKPFQQNILISKIKILLELNRQKQKIVESERMYRMLLNASPEGIVILDTNGRISEISDITSEIFGLEKKEKAIGKELTALFPSAEQDKMREILKITLAEGLTQNVEIGLSRVGREPLICEISTTLIQERDGKPKAFMAIIRDISQRKKLEQQLINAERLAGLGEMATGIAHELNQPLNTISLGLENLLDEIGRSNKLDKEYFQKKTQKIFDNILRITYIIDHIRTFSRGYSEFIHSSFNCNDSIRNGISMISEQFKHKGLELVLDMDEKISNINGNTYRFEQVILNLLLNAKDAIEEKRKTLNTDFLKVIGIKTYQKDQHLFVEVRDNGIGIKPEVMDKIMFPFYTTKELGKGTGLGLSISYGIIKEMNGDIEVESEYTVGTMVRIILPAEIMKQ